MYRGDGKRQCGWFWLVFCLEGRWCFGCFSCCVEGGVEQEEGLEVRREFCVVQFEGCQAVGGGVFSRSYCGLGRSLVWGRFSFEGGCGQGMVCWGVGGRGSFSCGISGNRCREVRIQAVGIYCCYVIYCVLVFWGGFFRFREKRLDIFLFYYLGSCFFRVGIWGVCEDRVVQRQFLVLGIQCLGKL